MQANLYKALLSAQKALNGVSKDSSNSFANYSYVSAEMMVRSARAVLFKNGLVLSRKSWSYALDADGAYRVSSTFVLAHPESAESIESTTEFPAVTTRKGLPADKSCAVSLTSSLSYFLRDLLLIPRYAAGENMDEYDDSDTQSTPKPKAETPSFGNIDEINQRLRANTL